MRKKSTIRPIMIFLVSPKVPLRIKLKKTINNKPKNYILTGKEAMSKSFKISMKHMRLSQIQKKEKHTISTVLKVLKGEEVDKKTY